MWAKSALLSAIFAVGAFGAPASVRLHPSAAFQPQWVLPAQDRGDIRPLREIVEELRSQYGGELISARLEQGGSPVYVIRWRMPDGQVRDFRVNAGR
jgi:hypothetical protein